jgi:sigma-B regulation protein RsbU (phosphoserine phosphatase)
MSGYPLTKPLLATLATLFAAAAIVYSGLWIYCASRTIPVELGFDNQYIPRSHAQSVKSVLKDSPAERAGIRKGDRIVAINGEPLEEDTLVRVWSEHKPGDSVAVTVERPQIATPIVLHGIFRASGPASAEAGVVTHVGVEINSLFPVVFLTVALAVLFLRVDDRNAWLMALMFASFIAIPPFPNAFLGAPLWLRPFAVAYRSIFDNLVAPLFYFFFATFPVRSAIDRRVPWLKWIGLLIGASLASIALRAFGRARGGLEATPLNYMHIPTLCFNYGLIVLGFISLTSNAINAPSSEARRKIRVILLGTLVGVIPPTLVLAANDFFGYNITLWVGAAIILLLWLFPASFAYAVVKHRVLEVPVLLRRSARYLLVQRGFVILLVVLSVGTTIAFALIFSRYLESEPVVAVPGGISLGAIFGTCLLWTGSRVHKSVGKRIDRAFFRNAYDAQVLLQDLLEKTRTVTDRSELAALLDHHLKQALQPSSVVVYFETREGRLTVAAGDVPPGSEMISPADAFLEALARSGGPRELSSDSTSEKMLLPALVPLRPDCLVPILGRDNRLAGLIVLGMRLSEEPYSREDKHLLAAVASQTGVALESFRLGEKVAERIEAERRTAQEMDFARQVQMRLLPQKLPAMKTLDYAGGCIPARTVGGDYYDFLELRPGRLGMVLADIAGKGVPGALMMANLQANLRSQYAMAVEEMPRLLASVNHLFYQSTEDSSYATLILADYDDENHVLRYANCGHLPAILLRGSDGAKQAEGVAAKPGIVKLPSTCTVLGMFEDWQCGIAEVRLGRGDTLVLYTDGITEASNDQAEEFGERRLIETLTLHSHLPAAQLLDSVVGAVRQFGSGEQEDDITMIVARCLS